MVTHSRIINGRTPSIYREISIQCYIQSFLYLSLELERDITQLPNLGRTKALFRLRTHLRKERDPMFAFVPAFCAFLESAVGLN